jgi:putative ABC transport system permease protein
MRNKRWLMLALLIGNILLLSITGSNVMYTHAALQRSLNQNLNDYMAQTGNYPGLVTITTNNSPKKNQVTRDAAVDIRKMGQTLGLPSLLTVEHYTLGEQKATPLQDRENGMRKSVTLSTLRELDKHSTLVAGRFYSPTPNPDGSIDVMVSQQAMITLDVLLDECFTISKLTGPDGQPLLLRVCGVFRNSTEDDLFWVQSPSELNTECFLHEEIFESLFITGKQDVSQRGFIIIYVNHIAPLVFFL